MFSSSCAPTGIKALCDNEDMTAKKASGCAQKSGANTDAQMKTLHAIPRAQLIRIYVGKTSNSQHHHEDSIYKRSRRFQNDHFSTARKRPIHSVKKAIYVKLSGIGTSRLSAKNQDFSAKAAQNQAKTMSFIVKTSHMGLI